MDHNYLVAYCHSNEANVMPSITSCKWQWVSMISHVCTCILRYCSCACTHVNSIHSNAYIAAVVAHQKIICISMRSMIPSGTSNSRQTAKISGNLLMHLHRLTMLHTSKGQVTGLMGIHTFSISKGAFYDYSNSSTSIMYY